MGETAGMGRGRTIDRLRKQLHICEAENTQLCAKLAAWDRWEHAWVFGGDAAYPGKTGVTDLRETLDALERLALGVEVEEADDG